MTLTDPREGQHMARKTETVVHLTDDLDGSTAAQTVSFAYQGTSYEIDLSKKNATAFDKAISTYVGSARKVRNERKASSSRASSTRNLGAIREWATANGYEVSSRGRIAGAVVEAYDAAN